MKKWVVRIASLLVFNILVLLLIGMLLPQVRVGWSVLWAAVILTAATVWVKPLITTWFSGMAATSASGRTKAGEKVVQFFLVLLVAYIVWVLTLVLSGVRVSGWFWGYVIPPVLLLIAWAIYDLIDDRLERTTGALYDKATRRTSGAATDASAPVSPATESARRELHDGLTDEQRRMLDELGNS